MTNLNKRVEFYATISRTTPALFFYLTILNCIISPSYNSFYLFITYCLVVCSNFIFKDLIIKPIYKLLNKTSLPILGIGSRPSKAESCALILDGITATSFGMPSGHSQIAWSVATYILYKIINNWYKNKKENKIITVFGYIWLILSCIIVLMSAIYISYSRVYIEGCHTIQQVTVGGILGVICGFLVAYYENDALNLMSKIY
jgi:membrane-associated phospholipid phosphatase